ncbi:MAG: hypothetical protein IJS45_06745 [Clostridia bacterium]|nr:hypothetical protein [Clostridia bacterium]
MENGTEISREELEKLIEKAKADLQATLDKMTPEEREQAELKAKKMIEEDEAKRKRLLETGAKIASESGTSEKPKFCSNCGAKAGDGKFCEFCGSPLTR